MITFFSSAKPFRGQTAIQQRNAIGSWLRLMPDIEVMLFGRDEGVAEICAEFGLTHVPDVECSEFGTPLLSHMYRHVQTAGRHPIACYINADIILLEDFAGGLARVAAARSSFVMTGRRTNLDFDEPLDFDGDWRSVVRDAVTRRGVPGAAIALDYFVFRRGSIPTMPPFAIGRPAWDNWLLMDVRRRGVDLIDASPAIRPIHQNHGYNHVPKATGQVWEGPEADQNRRLAQADYPLFQPRLHSIYSANRILMRWAPVPALTPRHLWWKIYAWAEYRNYYRRALDKYPGLTRLLRSVHTAVAPFFPRKPSA
jgi:hypothetical protein